jgi:GINS complex subunit 3
MDSSQNSLKADKSGLTMKLDELEKRLFHIGQVGIVDFDKWLKRKCHKIRISSISLNSRKRRRHPSSTLGQEA